MMLIRYCTNTRLRSTSASRVSYQMALHSKPPQAGKTWPVIHLLFSDATNKTMSAMSSTVPQRSAALVRVLIMSDNFCHVPSSVCD